MNMERVIVILVFIFQNALTQNQPKSCADVYKSNVSSARGEYTLYNNNGDSFKVYCIFSHGYGYTFISPGATANIDIDNLYTDSTHVLIRDLRTDGTQYEAQIEQITAFKQTPLSIQYNSSNGYHPAQNLAMSPYVFLGFIPVSAVQQGQTEGYRLNGNDLTFRNCDSNSNSYFAFLFNQNNASPSDYHQTASTLQKIWANGADLLPQSEYLPESYYSFFEMHFGGCGAYGTPQHIASVKGAALGLRYDITCPTPVDIAHATKVFDATSVGATVTYTCEVGYTWLAGDLSRDCDETGKWTGQEPNCGSFPCDSHPCQHDGLCFELEGANFVCECIGGFGGTLCETPL